MRTAFLVALCVTTLGAGLPAQAPGADALATYKQYLTVLAKAKALDEILPYYTKGLADGLRKMPADMQGNYLKMNARTLTDLEVTKQDVGTDKAEFQLKARTPTGAATSGTATLVKEDGKWKIDDEAWAAPAQ
jgi:hypothetical protein